MQIILGGSTMTDADEITGMYEVLEAIEAALRTADPAQLKSLAETIDAYAKDFPEEFFWATGAQAPWLLANTIDCACRSERARSRVGLSDLWIVSPKACVSLINGNRFIETGAGRVDKALLAIRRIGNLAAPSYESTEAERQKIIDAILQMPMS
jgi:hypothetical protein